MTWLHTLDPFAIQFTENFGIRWYGLAYLAGFVASYYFIRLLARRGLTPLPPEKVGDFVFAVAVGVVVGGRLGYCIFYNPNLFLQFTSSPPFWGALAMHQGGMASHGGILGLFLACLYFSRKEKLPLFALADLTTVGGSLGVFFGRLANFVNGELPGRPVSGNTSWAVKFPQEILNWPAQSPEKLADLAPAVTALGTSKEQWLELTTTPLSAADLHTIEPILQRVIASVQQGNLYLQSQLMPLLTARYPSQLYAALLEGLTIFVLMVILWCFARRPGVIAASYMFLYPTMRILSESYRLPDAHLGFQAWGLTRGQWLSVAMYGCALAVAYFVFRSSRDTSFNHKEHAHD
ncbi:MAG: prolipoprotein diacylglyceryl transferase [Bdellovibrionota bacterium]|nr:MAG: prolipoprotein diacylglyceryl transferase [Bdellovibrionota bacterium]